ncbi:hypothetical protein JDV02_006050 [Purpureocillium takamizusanense]|uniref:Cnl2/NKP2 family protein n=1 Tax=Purpureocillium takamizusanense TaxID=2060973 RepID=A0A9Q8VCK7_9HYPO|nr:uncharacterized protein JDV02_006050 [Purpureocillium takamizusanense]UNI19907.1 hypothetical protein JDV02_006050 [Purpureocillium takamizusanense]
MAPNESEILTNYLLQPAPLTAITTFEQFRAFFPRPLQSSPQVRALFRDLQARRNAVVDAVAANIAAEAKRGAVMRREVLRLRREAERDDVDGEIEMERALFGDESGAKKARHTLPSVVPELDGAADALEAEIKHLEAEERALLESIRQTVGGLSDLRYGKLANDQLRDDILDGLKSLQAACDAKS